MLRIRNRNWERPQIIVSSCATNPLAMGAGFVMQKKPLVAIVDDEDSVRDALAMLVRSLGHNASKFGSAEEFLEFEKLHDTSCLITDVQMPGLSGVDLQDHLIARGHRIPIIFVTGSPDENLQKRATRAGAICFLSKPYDYHHLRDCIDKALTAT